MAARRARSVARRRSPVLLILSALVLGVVGGYCCFLFTSDAVLSTDLNRIPWLSRKQQPSARTSTPAYRLYYSVAEYDGHNAGIPKLFSVKADGSGQYAYSHPGGVAYCFFESVSYDGKRVAYTDGTDVSRELYVSEVDGKNAAKVDEAFGILDSAVFMPDGKSLAYRKWRDLPKGEATTDLYLATLDGKKIKQLTRTNEDETPLVFSIDGSRLYFSRYHAGKDTPGVDMVLEPTTGKAQKVTGAIPKRPGPQTQYKITTKETGRRITVGVDGDDTEVDETVDTLNLILPGSSDLLPITHGYQITVLGWARE